MCKRRSKFRSEFVLKDYPAGSGKWDELAACCQACFSIRKQIVTEAQHVLLKIGVKACASPILFAAGENISGTRNR
jgi:tRNA pseudouridine-54 N-methylase